MRKKFLSPKTMIRRKKFLIQKNDNHHQGARKTKQFTPKVSHAKIVDQHPHITLDT